MPAPKPGVAPVSEQGRIARLEALAAEMTSRGWTAHVITAPRRGSRLFVQHPASTAGGQHILAAPDNASGEWHYWFVPAEPIAPAGSPAQAAEAIVRALGQGAGRAAGPANGTAAVPQPADRAALGAQGFSGTAGQHPALITDHDSPPTLTLVLPPSLAKDQVLAGLATAIGQVRADLAARAQLFQHRVEQNAAAGNQLAQALCRGQVIAGEHAAATIDEAIVCAFGLWDQYEAQLSTARGAAVCPLAPEAPSPAEGPSR
jgi:hypothetical protein